MALLRLLLNTENNKAVHDQNKFPYDCTGKEDALLREIANTHISKVPPILHMDYTSQTNVTLLTSNFRDAHIRAVF